MKSRSLSLILSLSISLVTPGLMTFVQAGTEEKPPAGVTATPDLGIPLSQEFELNSSYTGRSEVKQGRSSVGGLSAWDNSANYVLSPQITENVLLRFGARVENDGFSLTQQAPLPNTLRSYNAIVGADFTLSDKIILRVEAHPGLYGGAHLSGDDFMCPVQIGGSYLYSQDLQVILGFQINPDSDIPFIGGPGIRWQFADHWVLMGIPPKPRVEFEFNRKLTLYAGTEFNTGTYRLDRSFGDTHGRGNLQGRTLDSGVVDNTEIRVGGGAEYKPIKGLTVDLSSGIVPYRDLDFKRAGVNFHSWSTAPYVELGLSGSF